MATSRIPIQKTYKLYIGGKFPRTESGHYYPLESSDGEFLANVCLASRKDLRNAVVAARSALGGWSKASAFNRGQILYRLAEMLEGRKEQFAHELAQQTGATENAAAKTVQQGIDLCVHYSGWTDKFQQISSTVNPVASPHFNFSVPEPVGVVGIICPPKDGFLGLLSAMLPVIAGGNTAVVIPSESEPLSSISLAEAMATSDFPGGVVNMLTGRKADLLPHLKIHMDVTALSIWDATDDEKKEIRNLDEDNLKRIHFSESGDAPSPYKILDFQEIKTTWHPISMG